MEFTGTTAALDLLDRLLHDYGQDARVTHVLDTRTFYVVPRVNPDGAEAGARRRPFQAVERPAVPTRGAARTASTARTSTATGASS